MRKYLLTAVAAVPLLFHTSNAAQSWRGTSGQQYFGWPSEEGGTGAYLGVDVCDVTADRVGALKLKEEKGVEVTMVDQDAPAGKAGLKEHDVILSVNGGPVESAAQLRRVIHETPAGRVVALGISRGGEPVAIKVQLAERSKAMNWGPKVKEFTVNVTPPEMPEMPAIADFDIPGAMVVLHSSARSGLTVENLTPQLGEFFGVKDGRGVLVRTVVKGSRAEKAGLRAGDVIVRINDQPVQDTTDFSYALRRLRDGKTVTLGVVRDRREQNLSLPLPEVKESGELIEPSGDIGDIDVKLESLEELDQVDGNQMDEVVASLQPELELASRYVVQASEEQRKAICDQKQIKQQLRDQAKQRKKLQPAMRKQMREIERWTQQGKMGPLEI